MIKKICWTLIVISIISFFNVYAVEDQFKIYDELNKKAIIDNIRIRDRRMQGSDSFS